MNDEVKIGMQINNEVSCKLMLSFWVCVIRHILCNISRKPWGTKLIFCLQINAKVFNKFIVSLWVCIARHAQSTQKTSLQYLCNISRKTWRMKLIFCLQLNVKGFSKLIPSFSVCATRPKITSLLFLLNILRKSEWWSWFFTCR